MNQVIIRRAEAGDVPAMALVLAKFSQDKLLLDRSEDDIYQHLQEFVVADCEGLIVGTVALHIYGSNLAEIRSLAVSKDFQKNNLGKMLVQACETMAEELHVALVFALTYVSDFFIHLGYHIVPKEALPYKVWTVCVHCEKFSHCDEIAVQKRLSDEMIKPMHMIPIYNKTEI
ncbi:MAG: GNAT family N-acetyltransferase [Zetaproteobacteria bacterium CG_4_9_14_3_um_filter_49_83]|nr:MAG: GNAT family N-acetyltransferase [Zetaproteobacteria bacterium CG1_02_49_23]PIQ32451.1 MAG: GNAT family N-acetyltransferase [Zetaproteobacteria bacterium CG17_big_fil_post_rev_8_21_14_2_50_50_13]PIV31310.1 MAG: GNAT family N-acetyltransferase [Zetaproteobacteria bacterium CG02_land_8_20_14_3_00_50_9]PIY55055.1 MAG: GNAT family N-acetyltransferase [Zetaproteobacteria bacterium CG_4_10_14_0_8_um_filter_49_80]PJA35930.1 MAG: GNAT family N-acetyltransferase [Zetaproteobacteria bacterium CG_4